MYNKIARYTELYLYEIEDVENAAKFKDFILMKTGFSFIWT